MRTISVFFRVLAFALGGLCPLAAFTAPVEFEIPAQRADDALLLFSKQAKVEIVFSSDALRQATSTAVSGAHEPQEALASLLRGTGFKAKRNFRGKFVVMAAPGAISGQLRTADGRAAQNVRVSLHETKQSVVTNARGEFVFPEVTPGDYHLVAGGPGYQTLQFGGDARVESGRTHVLEPQTLRPANEPARLNPMVVEGRVDGGQRRGDDSGAAFAETAAGNLDLPRTRNDAIPYTVYNREQISRSGVVNLNEFLQRNLLDSDATTQPPERRPEEESLDTLSAGSSNLKMRGYSPDETIVLVNGRRLPEALMSGPNDRQPQTPDVNFIPLSLVERVEVLPVSASAMYSGNAVGGVINIVLRPDFNATEVTATYTNALGGFDSPQSSLSLQHGSTLLGGKLRVRFNATLTRTIPPTESELGYVATKLAAENPSTTLLHRATPNVSSADGSPLFGTGTASFTSVAPGANGGGLPAFAGRAGVASTALFDSPGGMGNSPDSRDFPYGRRQEGYSYFASATYDLTRWLQIGFDGIETHNVLNRGFVIFPGDLSLRAGSPFNPFGKDVKVALNETVPQLGEFYSETRVDFQAAVAGVLVRLPRQWRVSADAQYGHNRTRFRGLAGVDPDRWQALVDAGIYNPLRDTQRVGPPAEFYDRALIYHGGRGRFVTLGNYTTLDAALRVSNRSLPLPTGSAAVNFGGDYRRNHLRAFSNEQRYGDGTLVGPPNAWSARTIQRVSAFGEIQAPLLPEKWLPRAVQGIDVDLAGRYTAADTSQETNFAPTAGFKVQLVGGWALRGSVATSNRFPPPVLNRRVAAPSSGTGGGDVSLSTVRDPLRGGEEVHVPAIDEINPNLRPEAAVSRTVGLVYLHGKAHRVRLAVDFIDTRKSQEIFGLNAQDAVTLEAAFPGRVKRAPPAPGDTASVGPITSILTGAVNLAWRESQNWSTSFEYSTDEFAGGRLETYAEWIYFQKFKVQLLPGSPSIDELAHPDTTSAALMRHRVNFGAVWSGSRMGIGFDGHYYHSRVLPVFDWPNQGSDRIKPLWQFDTYLQGDLTRLLPGKNPRIGLRAQLRVNNVFDTPPPRYANHVSQTGVQAYGDWRGRVYSLSVTATF